MAASFDADTIPPMFSTVWRLHGIPYKQRSSSTDLARGFLDAIHRVWNNPN